MYILSAFSPDNPETVGVRSKTGAIHASPSVPRGHLQFRSPIEGPLTAKLSGLVIHRTWQTGAEGLYGGMDANNLTGSQFQPMSQKTSEEVQPLLTWRGQPVHPVSYFQKLEHGRVLRSLGVWVVQL